MGEWFRKICCPRNCCGALVLVTGLFFTFYAFADVLLMQYDPERWFVNVRLRGENPLFPIECLLLAAFLNCAYRFFRELLAARFPGDSFVNRKYYLWPLIAVPPLIFLAWRFSGNTGAGKWIVLFLTAYSYLCVLIPAAWKTSGKMALLSIMLLLFGAVLPFLDSALAHPYLDHGGISVSCPLGLVYYLMLAYLLCRLGGLAFPGAGRRAFLTLMTIGVLAVVFPSLSEYHFRRRFERLCEAFAAFYGETPAPETLKRIYEKERMHAPELSGTLPDFSADFPAGGALSGMLNRKIGSLTKEEIATLREWAARSSGRFAEMDGVTELPAWKEKRDFSGTLSRISAANLTVMRSWCPVYRLRARLAILNGDKQELPAILKRLEHMDHMLRSDVTLPHLLGSTFARTSRLAVQRDLLERGMFTDGELAELQKRLAAEEAQNALLASRALFYEGAMLIQTFRKLSPPEGRGRGRLLPWRQMMLQDQACVLATLYEVARLLPADYYAICDSVDRILHAQEQRPYSVLRDLLADLRSCLRRFAYLSAEERVLLLDIAEERARRAGKPLKEFLPEIPVDPFTGKTPENGLASKQD